MQKLALHKLKWNINKLALYIANEMPNKELARDLKLSGVKNFQRIKNWKALMGSLEKT